MKPVIPPIIPDTQGEHVFNLQEILQFLVDREFIKIKKDEWDIMLPDFNGEKKKQFYGRVTANLVVQFRMQNALGDGREVDEATAKAINALLDVLVIKLNVTGTVRSANRRPASNILVKAFHEDMRSLVFLGEAFTNKEGRYEITYTDTNPDQSKREITNLVVFTYDRNNQEITHSKTYFNAPPSATVDLFLSQEIGLSEYEVLIAELKPLMKELSFEELTAADIDFLTGKSQMPGEHINLLRHSFLTASKYVDADHKALFPVPAFYGWFRQGLPIDSHVLFARPAEELITSILTAIKTQVIPTLSAEVIEKIKEAVKQLAVERLLTQGEGLAPSLGEVLNTIPAKLPIDKQFVVATVLQDKSNADIPLREKLKKGGLDEMQTKAVERTLAFKSFSRDFLPLIKTLQEDAEINSLQQLALKVNKETFTRKIIDNKAFPEGETPADFSSRLYNNLFHAEPTAMLRNMVEDDKIKLVEDAPTRTSVATFLSRLPETFNIKTTSVYEAFKDKKAFEGIAPEFHGKVKAELKSLQRITAISPSPDVVPVLMKAHVTSSFMISDMPEEQFVRDFSAQLGKDGEAIARQVHTNAVNARIRNEQALISFKEVQRGTGIRMVDEGMKNHFSKDNKFREILEGKNLSWDLLFGDADFCECGECTSVYSAAAYYVDLLQYLRNNNLDPDARGPILIGSPNDISGTPLQKLFVRRPDLMCLQLTCKNTNTILPYIDLVNEVMESYVAIQRTIPFNVGEDETSGELLAEPQHTEYTAYRKLKGSVFPFTLPYHQPVDAERIYLNSLGTSRFELMNTFRSVIDSQYVLEPLIGYADKITLSPIAGDLDDLYQKYLDNAVDAEYLGLTEEEYVILTKEAFVSKEYWDKQSANVHTQPQYLEKIKARSVHEYYGYDQESAMLSIDEQKEEGLTFVKKQFLKRTGLQYLELVELLKTQYLFPGMPKEQSLSILGYIDFSYSFLQALVHDSTDPMQKYESVIGFLLPTLLRENNDLCESEAMVTPMTELEIKQKQEWEAQKVEGVKQWIFQYFETAGRMIVLENEVKCIDGRLGIQSDNPEAELLSYGYIEKCQIYGEMGELIGAVDRRTGLVTMKPGQPEKDWTNSVLISASGENTAFIKILGKSYLISSSNRIDTCNLDKVRLIHLDGTAITVEEYDRIHRFIRLWRKSGWTINETDKAIVSFSKTKSFDISPQLLHQLAAVKKIHEKSGLELVKLFSFWTNIDTVGEKSLYKRLFLTHNLRALDNVFHPDAIGGYLTGTVIKKIKDHGPVLMAALNLKTDEIEAIITHEKIEDLTLENVSKLYRYRLLSKLVGLRVTEFISALPLFADPFADADATLLFLEQWKKIEDAGFNHLQLNYIIQGKDDPKKPTALTKQPALQLAKILFDGLNAIEEAHQDLKANPEITDPLEQENERYALASSELIQEKTAQIYDQATIEKIIGVLEGTTIYAASGTAGVKDLLRPIPLTLPATTQDYEFLQLDNYPLLKKKIKYDSTKGSLQVEGILTEFEGEGSSQFFADDIIDLDGLLTRLTGTDVVSQYVWNKFTASGRAIITAPATTPSELRQEVINELNKLINGSASIYDAQNFIGVTLSDATKKVKDKTPAAVKDELVLLNRMLLQDAYPKELAKNKRIGFNTILNNLSPDLSLQDALLSIKTQRTNLSREVFNGIFAPSDINFFTSGDSNHLPMNGESNTAPLKRLKFLEAFLPYLRNELRHRFVVNTLASQTGLSNAVTDLLITDILKIGAGNGSVSVSVFLDDIDKKIYPNYNRWEGSLIPSADGQYTFIVKDSYTRPNLFINGNHINFVAQENSPFEWWSTEQKLLAGQQYKVELYRINPEEVYWKIDTSSVTPIPPTFGFLLSAWDGFIIPAVDGKYTFNIKVKGSAPVPALSVDGIGMNFTERPVGSGEWWSAERDFPAGKSFRLRLRGMSLETLYWKTATSPISPIPPTAIMTGWEGYLIPSIGEQYTFIVKGSKVAPDLTLDDKAVDFEEQNPGEWWSKNVPKLRAGKIYRLFLPEVNMESLFWKTATSSITSIPSASLLPGYAERKIVKAFTHLQKAAMLINGFKLSADEVLYLSVHSVDFENLNFNAIQLAHFLRLESYTRFRNSLAEAKINILEFFNWTYSAAASSVELGEKIEALAGWKRISIEKLIQEDHFNLIQPDSFHNEINLIRLQTALEVANKINIDIGLLFDWAKPESDFDNCRKIADSIKHAIRAKYNQEDWEQVVKPLSDKLRENQKNALIAYLLVQLPVMKWGVTDPDGLFEFFLIDVQMDACMETSRIKQAISSVQLFVQRCFLGLESRMINGIEEGISHKTLDRQRWDWMQRYRVWEANRKVFLYPENWIESNLRDDKSPFFKELESELLQKDINTQNVIDALKGYLYKVDEVANMEVVGVHVEMEIYEENGQSIDKGKKLHVFSRTRTAPYFFYYRYLDMLEGNWYPWERMQVDIPSYDMEEVKEITKDTDTNTYKLNPKYKTILGNGCYITPIVWNNRLLIFFPQFMRKTKPNEDVAGSKSIKDLSEDSTDSAKPIEYWEIKMGWSEYRNGKWTQKQLSKDAIYDIPDVNGFWQVFNAAYKVRAKSVAAQSEYEVKNRTAWRKRDKWTSKSEELRKARATAASDAEWAAVDTLIEEEQRAWDTYKVAWDKEIDALANAEDAAAELVGNVAITALQQLPPPPPGPDISKYEFVPVISNTDKLLGIKIYYDSAVKGVFEFNGSNITSNSAGAYSGNNSVAAERFHHSGGGIRSLQINNPVQDHRFGDLTNTTYHTDNNHINFYHADAIKMLGIVNEQQLETFFKFPLKGIGRNPDKDDVFGGYDKDQNAQTPNSYHELKRPYSIYNWELFFHTPMMLADALSKAQQFEEAMKWYHYVFSPVADGQEDNRFWQFSSFKSTDAKNILDQILNKLKPNESNDDINEWRSNPFKPHLVARSRPVAYMKWVVMKYIDNLVAWGDYLFRQDTIESINQATQLYVLAGHILGPRPQMIPKRGNIKPQTYLSLLDKWDANSNAMVELEMVFPFSNQTLLPMTKPELAGGSMNYSSNHAGSGKGEVGIANVFGFASSTYFCVPNNPNLLGYWDTISDRLFKIRHCENIEGIFRKLPLFEPPIDPALLVKAAAQGLSISSVVNDLNSAMPNYRFYYLLQKALELCNELKSLGGSMLSAIEKKDNETIALIRARHENSMLNLVTEVKKQQLEEAQKTLEGLQQNRKAPEHRMKYYLQLIGENVGKVPGTDSDFSEIANVIETPIGESGLKLIKHEKEEMDKANLSADLQLAAGVTETLAGILYAIPMLKGDVAPMGIGAGVAFGGTNLGQLTQAISKVVQLSAGHLSHQSSSAAKKGGFQRALQDRVMQANAAGYEIKQIDKQILAQQIRIGIATVEISNHQKQIENAQEIEEFLKNKYTNEELYTWMRGSLKTLYRQVYNLAYDLAKKAEKTYCFERGISHANFIQSGYFDAGREGLLAGEQLFVGLKQLECSYQEKRYYDYEIAKHVSVRQLNPMSLLQLKASGSCEFDIPEVLFDMDFPGHFKRRIKSVSVSIPCIAGPYIGVNATLRLLNNKIRNSSIANNYPEKTDEQDDRFVSYNIPITAIATSSAQNDAGMFELNFKDERYLPFEGAGVISSWRLELPTIQQFDYNTISDVVLHVRYTASEGGGQFKASATSSVNAILDTAAQLTEQEGLFTLINLKHDMPNEWNVLKKNGTAEIKIDKSRLPYFAQVPGTAAAISKVILISKSATPPIKRKATLSGTAVELDALAPMGETGLYRTGLMDVSFDEPLILTGDETAQNKLNDLALIVKFGL